jgi:hypothetical protein
MDDADFIGQTHSKAAEKNVARTFKPGKTRACRNRQPPTRPKQTK